MTNTVTLDLPALQRELSAIIEASDAEFGVCLRHIESGAEILINPDALYPMASVFKIPILIETLAQVDEGILALDQRFELRDEDRLPPSGVLTELDTGLPPTLHDLLMLMIIVSDNTATDMVLETIGADRLERRLRSRGIESISVKMGVQGLFDATFITDETRGLPMAFWRELRVQGSFVDVMTGKPIEAAQALFQENLLWDGLANQRTLANNVSTPRDMGRLLEMLMRGELLSERSTRVALDILLRQQLNQRIPRFLPPSVPIAHKTGTFLGSRNDAGIIYLPDGSHLITVTFAILRRDLLDADPKVSSPYIDRVDSAMGYIARAGYDAFAGASSTEDVSR